MLSDLSPRGAIVVEVVCLSVAFIFLLLYWYVRAHLLRQFATSDILITFAWIFMLANVICDTFSVKFGLWNPKIKYTTHGLPDFEKVIHDRATLQKALKFSYGTIPVYYAVLYEIKAAILIMYLKMFPKDFVKLRIALMMTIGFVAVGLVLVLGLNFLWCVPVQRNWSIIPEERCLSYASLTPYFFSSGFNILSDLMIFALPFFLLPKLTTNSSRRKLAGISVVFSLGLLCIICTVARIVSVGRSSTSSLIAAWSSAEMGVAVIVACCPPLKYLLYAHRRARGSSAASGSHHGTPTSRRSRRTWPSLPSLPSFKSRSRSRSKSRGSKMKIKGKSKEGDIEATIAIATIASGTTMGGSHVDRTGRSLTVTGGSSYIQMTGTDGQSAALTGVDIEVEMADSYGGLSPRGSARPIASMPPAVMRSSVSSNYSPLVSAAVSAVGDSTSVVSMSRTSSSSSRNNSNNASSSASSSFEAGRKSSERNKSSRRSAEFSGWRKWIRGGGSAGFTAAKEEQRKKKEEFGNLTFGGSGVRSDWRSRERIREEDEPDDDAHRHKHVLRMPPKAKPKISSTLKVRGIGGENYEMRPQPSPIEENSKHQSQSQGSQQDKQRQSHLHIAAINNTFNHSFVSSNHRRSLSPHQAGFGFLNSEYMEGNSPARRPSDAPSASTLGIESRRTSKSSYVNGGDNVCGNFGTSIFGGD